MKSLFVFTFVFFLCLTVISVTQVWAGENKVNYAIQSDARGYLDRNTVVGANKAKYVFRNGREPGQIDRVKVQLKVGGEGFSVKDGKEQREKMNVDSDFDYDEKTLEMPANDKGAARSIRSYQRVEAEIKVGDKEFKPLLRPERTLIAAEITANTALLFSPSGPLTREELELVNVQANSLLMDCFLPNQPVALRDTWKHSERLMAQLLGLDEVGQTDVQSVLTEVTDKVARFEMFGNVSGAVEGVTSEIELKARYRFNLQRKRIDWLGMLIKEKRQSSPVSDGVDVTAQLQMTIVPSERTERLSETALNDLPMQSTPELIKLYHLSKRGGWEVTHDRDWYIFRDKQELAILRRLDRGEVIAQGHISSLPQAKPDKLVSLEEFQEDVKRALAKEFKEFVEAGQTVDAAGRRVLRVVARGTASDLPILWTYYHLADQQGRQMGFVFTCEEKYADLLGKADRELVDSLRFVEVKP